MKRFPANMDQIDLSVRNENSDSKYANRCSISLPVYQNIDLEEGK